MDAPPLLFDRPLHRRRLDRASRRFAAADFLKARAALDAVERLEVIMRSFPIAVDLGARNGAFARLLAESPAAARIGALIEADLSDRMLEGRSSPRLVADEERLPFAPESLDLVVSTLALHWTNDLPGALVQIRRALKPDGLFLGTVFGRGTLSELRQSLLQAEDEVRGGAGPRVSPFVDVRDAAHLLQRAGFALPVGDVDKVEVRYESMFALLRDLRAMGETNALIGRAREPLGRDVLSRAAAIYAERFAGADGRITATFEFIGMTGWAPHPDQQKPLTPGSARMRLADALSTLQADGGSNPADSPQH